MRSEFKAQIDSWFDLHRKELLDDLACLISVNSIRSEAVPGKPYGEGCAKVLACAEELFRRDGFIPTNFDNHVITANLNDGETVLGILAHLDTVGVSDSWSSDPFTLRTEDGVVYGRGVADDKGPAVAAYYALRAAREIAPETAKNCRLILGSCEETGSSDIAYYRNRESFPPMVFTPDGNYPVVNFEKGRYAPVFEAEWQTETAPRRVISLVGGKTGNIVPKAASARIVGLDENIVRQYTDENIPADVTATITVENGAVVISVNGKAAHASLPESGVNAQTALLTVLAAMPLDDCTSTRLIRSLAGLMPHGDLSGKAIGIACADQETGALTFNFGVLQLTETSILGNCDIRMPLCADGEAIADTFTKAIENCGMKIREDSPLTTYHYTPPDTRFVRTLLDIYEDYTGNPRQCLAIGGGTYVHDIEGGVAFGCEMPDYDSRMHGDDERIPIDVLLLSAKMFTAAIIELCQ